MDKQNQEILPEHSYNLGLSDLENLELDTSIVVVEEEEMEVDENRINAIKKSLVGVFNL